MTDPLFQSFSFNNGLALRNRVVLAPMTTWSANEDQTISEQELAWYRARAQGVGLVLTGCTHVQASGIGFTNEFAAYDDRFIPSLRKLAAAAKSGGALAVLQIFHAGNKAVPSLIPDGDVGGDPEYARLVSGAGAERDACPGTLSLAGGIARQTATTATSPRNRSARSVSFPFSPNRRFRP